VVEIRWRYTALETRNWETLILPNSVLMKTPVEILGRRNGRNQKKVRRWVYFNVDFRHQPSDVIEVVEQALLSSNIEHMAANPAPNCVLVDLHESYGRYAVRYFLDFLESDDPTDSQVRTCIYFALRRADIPLSIPAHAIFVTEESTLRKEEKRARERETQIASLGRVELFSRMTDEERAALAAGLHYAPFTRGEVVTRQGAEAHWLYILIEGETSVRVSTEGGLEREVARVQAPSFFGEMSLMTGERRSATVVAVTDAECYRLDKSTFQQVLQRRPELAEHVASVLAKRRLELSVAKEGLDQEAAKRLLAHDEQDLLGRIRSFFGLSDSDRRAAG
jgi:CRP-like cAMP-binding protein